MSTINEEGILCKVIRKGIVQKWYPIRPTNSQHNLRGMIILGRTYFPKHLIGKKIQIKFEVLADNGKPRTKWIETKLYWFRC